MVPNNQNPSIEEEIKKQLDRMDKRFDRNGWFFLVILIVILFFLIYVVMNVFRVPDAGSYTPNAELVQQIDDLESRIENLESNIEDLEERLLEIE